VSSRARLIGWIAGLSLLAALGIGAAIVWHRTADARAALATRQSLAALAASIRGASQEPDPGLLPVNDAWGQPIELRPTPVARFLISVGADASPETEDDVFRILDLSPLGAALEESAAIVRGGGSPDLDALESAAVTAFGEGARPEVGQSITFVNASDEVLLEIDIDLSGRPILVP
jgi:hypothetical protein